MTRRALLHPTDLRGAARLATDAAAGLADLVEAMHAGIARGLPGLPGLPVAAPERTGGLTGLVYNTVRGVTRLVGGRVDALLGLLAPALDAAPSLPSAEREALVAALNGVLGDHLHDSGNPLAITMALRQGGRPLLRLGDGQAGALAGGPASAGPLTWPPGAAPPADQLLVLLHGLCMNDLQWTARSTGFDHGAALAAAGGFMPLYLHYNSGRSIACNGDDLARLLEDLVERWPRPVKRLVLLGHSMGGLVARSAVHRAQADGLAWPARLSDLVCLGSPHHGAPLERAGHGIDVLLGAAPYAAPMARLGKLRSAGITDLRHGRISHDEVRDPGHRPADGAPLPAVVPLPAGVRCFALAGCLAARPDSLRARLLGDGLVTVDSALGRHGDPARTLAFDAARLATVTEVGHLALLSEPAVANQLQAWLVPAAPAVAAAPVAPVSPPAAAP